MIIYLQNKKGKDKSRDKEEKIRDDEDEDKEKEPYDFTVLLMDEKGEDFKVKVGNYQKLQPPLKPEVFKSRLFWKDPESEVVQQYVALPLEGFVSDSGGHLPASEISSITFVFDEGEKGSVILDQIGFSR